MNERPSISSIISGPKLEKKRNPIRDILNNATAVDVVAEPPPTFSVIKVFSIFKFIYDKFLKFINDFERDVSTAADERKIIADGVQKVLNEVRLLPGYGSKCAELLTEIRGLKEEVEVLQEKMTEINAENELLKTTLREVADSDLLFSVKNAYIDLVRSMKSDSDVEIVQKEKKLVEILDNINTLTKMQENA